MTEVGRQQFEQETALLDKQLQDYILKSLKQGYGIQAIEEFLISRGYPQDEVRRVVKRINEQYYGGELGVHREHSLKPLVTILFILLLLGMGGYFLLSFESYESSVRLQSTSVTMGEDLQLIIQTNKPIELEYRISTAQGNFVGERQDSITNSKNYLVSLPPNLPAGAYFIDVLILRDEERSEYTLSFALVDETEEIVVVQTGDSDDTLFRDAVTQKNGLACATIQNLGLRDECYLTVSRDLNDGTLCRQISNFIVREDCYVVHVFAGDDSYCKRLNSTSNLAVCE